MTHFSAQNVGARYRRAAPLASLAIATLLVPELVAAGRFEAGRIVLPDPIANPSFVTLAFSSEFDVVPLVFLLPTEEDASPSTPVDVRIGAVSETGFSAAIVQPPASIAAHPGMTVDYFAIEPGLHDVPDGTGTLRIEAGYLYTHFEQGSAGGTAGWEALTYASTFASAPTLLFEIQTMNNEIGNPPGEASLPFLSVTGNNVTASGANLTLESGAVAGGIVFADEQVAYLAVAAAQQGTLPTFAGGTVSFETFITGTAVVGWDDTCPTFTFSNTYGPGLPLVFAGRRTRNGGDGGWFRRCSLTTGSVGVVTDEDQEVDTERSHGAEVAGILVLGGDFNGGVGSDALAFIDPTVVASQSLSLSVDDADRNLDPQAAETLAVTVNNLDSGEAEPLTLGETDADSGSFTGVLETIFVAAGTGGDGRLGLFGGQGYQLSYADDLRSDGVAAVVTAAGVAAQPAMDLSIAMLTTPNPVVPGHPILFQIDVANAGPSLSDFARLQTTPPAGLEDSTWTCVPAGGATCPASGTGSVLDLAVDLPSGGSLAVELSTTVPVYASGSLSMTASIVARADADETDPTNNAVTEVIGLIAECGDGLVTLAEACDDGGLEPDDGCSPTCELEGNAICTGNPSLCTLCGDGVVEGAEACDDGGAIDGDGCAANCTVEAGWSCAGSPSACGICGNGVVDPLESCDDGAAIAGDGCSDTCQTEAGWACEDQPSVCNQCGNGVLEGNETCDDGNFVGFDGCSITCELEADWICAGEPSVCRSCGNGIVETPEACDDANRWGSDGCSATCTVEAGWSCSGEPSVCEGGGNGSTTLDGDGDGWVDAEDNCPVDANPEQEDADEDGIGDVCDDDDTGGGTPGGGCDCAAGSSGATGLLAVACVLAGRRRRRRAPRV